VDYIHLVQDRDVWQALVNMVMDLLVSINAREYLECLKNY
jgi:hypothetical protein